LEEGDITIAEAVMVILDEAGQEIAEGVLTADAQAFDLPVVLIFRHPIECGCAENLD
jgi:hypothetical protein